MSQRGASPVAVTGAIALVYFAAAKLGLSMAFTAEQVTVVWPPTGIALSAVLVFGRRVWPGIWLGALAANATANEPIAVAMGIACGNTLEALAGGWLLRRASFDPALGRLRDVLALVILAAALSTTASATIGVLSLGLGGVQPWSAARPLWTIWWLGDAMGDVIAAPALLALASRRSLFAPPQRAVEAALLAAAVIARGYVLFGGGLGLGPVSHQLAYTIFPFVIWAALRFGQRGAAGIILLNSAMATWGTLHGRGPFSGGSTELNLVQLQIFMSVVAVTGLVLAAALTERGTAARHQAADHAVVSILSWSPSLDHAAPQIVRALGENLDADLAVLWKVGTAPGPARCLAAWRRDGGTRAPTESGLADRVAASGAPQWTPDRPAGARLYPRPDPPAGFAAPIINGEEEMIGVVELRSAGIRGPDEALARVIANVGSQVGQFVERRRAQAEREQLLAREQSARAEAELLVARLRQAEAELRRSDRAKNQFLAILGHELRNPLAPLRLSLDLLRLPERREGPERERMLGIMERQLKNLVRLVDDLLDLSRIATSRVELRREQVDLTSLMRHAADAVIPVIEERRHRLALVPAPEPLRLEADSTRLEQVFVNLLGNAARYTDPGGHIEFGARAEGTEAVVWVRDDGIGIPPELLESIFDLFVRVDDEAPRAQGRLGFGVGLTLARRLVEMHGGSVSAASGGPGQGSEFTVRLPLAAGGAAAGDLAAGGAAGDPAAGDPSGGAKPTSHPPASISGRPRRVLVVDDNQDAAHCLALLLEQGGHEVHVACDGPSALDVAGAQQPEVVFLDIDLPGDMDGYEVARRLRTREGPGNVLIVAVTGLGRDEDRLRSAEAGFDRHIVKPVEPESLQEIMLRSPGNHRTAEAGSA